VYSSDVVQCDGECLLQDLGFVFCEQTACFSVVFHAADAFELSEYKSHLVANSCEFVGCIMQGSYKSVGDCRNPLREGQQCRYGCYSTNNLHVYVCRNV
jgi:hypothetical protein